jgi:glutamate racemase
MEKWQRPIGVFDSGVGGISVLRELVALMPQEDYIFFGDSANAPYGTKSLEEVHRLTMADAAHLIEQGVKALVVACNTATSVSIIKLREKYSDMPVTGIEPALKPAVLCQANPRVLVMATPMTIREKKFQKLLHTYEEQARIIPLPCPGLVEYVERGELEGDSLTSFLQDLFAPYQKEGVDSVVLGCTHYPFVRDAISHVLGDHVRIFDGGAGTARETKRRLQETHLLAPEDRIGSVRIENSDPSEQLSLLAHTLLNR